MSTKDPGPSKPEHGKPETRNEVVQAAAAAAAAAAAIDDDGDDEDTDKRKYSRGLKEVQRTERRFAKAGRRFGRAIATGFDTYYDRNLESSYKKRDGAVRDALKNWAKAWEKTVEKSAGIPYDIAEAFDTKTMRRNIRTVVRFLAPPFLR
jgi:hypothetical protein